jgi:hypothetical protein
VAASSEETGGRFLRAELAVNHGLLKGSSFQFFKLPNFISACQLPRMRFVAIQMKNHPSLDKPEGGPERNDDDDFPTFRASLQTTKRLLVEFCLEHRAQL